MVAAQRALAGLEAELRAGGSLLPGVQALLERLGATPGVRQTLLTGNLTPNAAVKVAAFGITDHFDVEVGAYGTDHADRLELVPIALERVERLRGETYARPDEVWVIGDTANDLACARAGGVRCLLCGADAADLAPQADAWFETLADTDAVAAAILGPTGD
jgi:phosphoglycolate phosphatase-like HAD superfamily hydrolase